MAPKSASMGRRDPFARASEAGRAAKASKPVPHAFVLDELAACSPRTNPMFGCLAVYVGERIVFILRDRGPDDPDNGVWLAFEADRADAVKKRFPRLKIIEAFKNDVKGWLKLSAKSRDFEDDVLAACALVREHDPLLGKVPNAKKPAKRAKKQP